MKSLSIESLSDQELDDLYEEVATEYNKRNRVKEAIAATAKNSLFYYLFDEDYGDPEYGPKSPHYNGVLFVDKKFWDKNGYLNDDLDWRKISIPSHVDGGEYIESGNEMRGTREELDTLLQEWGFTPAPMDKKDFQWCSEG